MNSILLFVYREGVAVTKVQSLMLNGFFRFIHTHTSVMYNKSEANLTNETNNVVDTRVHERLAESRSHEDREWAWWEWAAKQPRGSTQRNADADKLKPNWWTAMVSVSRIFSISARFYLQIAEIRYRFSQPHGTNCIGKKLKAPWLDIPPHIREAIEMAANIAGKKHHHNYERANTRKCAECLRHNSSCFLFQRSISIFFLPSPAASGLPSCLLARSLVRLFGLSP